MIHSSHHADAVHMVMEVVRTHVSAKVEKDIIQDLLDTPGNAAWRQSVSTLAARRRVKPRQDAA